MQPRQRPATESNFGTPPVGGESTADTPPRRGPAARAFTSVRAGIGRHPTANRVYRTTVGVTGAGTVVLGVLLIPLPGPGSLIALGGLALLGTEFAGAKKASTTMNKAARAAVRKAQAHRAAKAEAAKAEAEAGRDYPTGTVA
ncbi:PGPGW domain-containing protein [Leifsonia sp. YAF41]|uniref:PGPGW domain-containing protein n=1 Tax=Leifsonia sp. YAF41 TaxID=3233086 RepID=UPI003F95B9E0